MAIEYRAGHGIGTDEFIDILRRSSLGERRPLHDRDCMEGMVRNASLMVTAWDGARLVGVARSVTDFHFACYLSDLAVDIAYQRRGIGKQLIAATLARLGPHCRLRLISAPAAADYYPKIGFTRNPQCWEILPGHRQ